MTDRLIAALAFAIVEAARLAHAPDKTGGAQVEALDARETRAPSVAHPVPVNPGERPDERLRRAR